MTEVSLFQSTDSSHKLSPINCACVFSLGQAHASLGHACAVITSCWCAQAWKRRMALQAFRGGMVAAQGLGKGCTSHAWRYGCCARAVQAMNPARAVPTCGSVLSSVQLMAITPGRMKQAMLSTWPLTTSVSPAAVQQQAAMHVSTSSIIIGWCVSSPYTSIHRFLTAKLVWIKDQENRLSGCSAAKQTELWCGSSSPAHQHPTASVLNPKHHQQ